VRGSIAHFDEVNGPRAVGGAKTIADFDQHGFGNPGFRAVEVVRHFNGLRMEFVASADAGLHVRCVHEYAALHHSSFE
jgi:hypothetical protein